MRIHDLPGGGPAFPSTFHHDHEGTLTQFAGITVRDWLIVHAPAEPQDWFQPVVSPRPVHPDLSCLTSEEKEEYNGWRNDNLEVKDIKSARVREVVRLSCVHTDAYREWQQYHRKQRLVQWPAAWADEQLKLRAAWLLAQEGKTHD